MYKGNSRRFASFFLLVLLPLLWGSEGYSQKIGSWRLRGKITESGLPVSVSFTDSATGYLISKQYVETDSSPYIQTQFVLQVTTDAGHTWQTVRFDSLPFRVVFAGFSFLKGNQIFMATTRQDNMEPVMLYSANNGVTWAYTSLPTYAYRYVMFNDREGLIFDLSTDTMSRGGRIYTTTDNWKTYSQSDGGVVFDNWVRHQKNNNPYVVYYGPLVWANSSRCFLPVSMSTGLTYLASFDRAKSWTISHHEMNPLDSSCFVGNVYAWSTGKSLWMVTSAPGTYEANQSGAETSFILNYLSSTDFGKSWSPNTDFLLRRQAFCPVGDSNIWISITRGGNTYHNFYDPYDRTNSPNKHSAPCSIVGFSTNNGRLWRFDSTSFKEPDIGEFDVRHIVFVNSKVGYAIAEQNGSSYIFVYQEHQASTGVSPNVPSEPFSFRYDENDKIIKLSSGAETLREASLFDVTGRLLTHASTVVHSKIELAASHYYGTALLVVKTDKGITTRKLLLK